PGRADPDRQLRDARRPTHIGAVEVVRPQDDDPAEVLAAVVDGQELARDLRAAIRVARVERIRHAERDALPGRDLCGGLIDLGARSEEEHSAIASAHRIDDIARAASADVEY